MLIQKKNLKPIHPSNFLRALTGKMAGILFHFNFQQDALEVLQVVFDNLKGKSILANDFASRKQMRYVTSSCVQQYRNVLDKPLNSETDIVF